MHFSTGAVALWCLSIGSASGFSTQGKSVAFVGRTGSVTVGRTHAAGCVCPACVSLHPAGCGCGACSKRTHAASCVCGACTGRQSTALFADVAEETEIPAEVEAMDGVESADEAHNVERPARSQLKKKRPAKGKELSEFEVGSMVKGTVKSITNYGAFVDIGATTDGLLHISQLSTEFIGDVNEVLKQDEDVEVRIVSIDTGKGQVGLSLISAADAAASQETSRQRRERPQRQQSNRRDDSAALASLTEKGWDTSAFVEGTVVSTVDFGCFVRIDASALNSECEGELDGLVHISALSSNRVGSVSDIVKVDDKVKVRVKGISGGKVSLTMLSVDEEDTKSEKAAAAAGPGDGAKDWKEYADKLEAAMPTFKNGPVIEDRRK